MQVSTSCAIRCLFVLLYVCDGISCTCRRYEDDDRDEDDKATELMNALRGYDPVYDH